MGNEMISMKERILARLASIHVLAPGSIGAQMNYSLVDCDEEAGEYTLLCHTFDWMRNIPGTLHGGMCATVVDQAMGFIAYCLKKEDGIAPTVQMSVDYHRPLIPGEDVLIRVSPDFATFAHLDYDEANACGFRSGDLGRILP